MIVKWGKIWAVGGMGYHVPTKLIQKGFRVTGNARPSIITEETNPLDQYASSSVSDGSIRLTQYGYRCFALCMRETNNSAEFALSIHGEREVAVADVEASILNACQTQNKHLIESATYCWKVKNLRFTTVLQTKQILFWR